MESPSRLAASIFCATLAVGLVGCGSVEYARSDDGWRASADGYGSDDTITLAVFYEELTPYGEWRDHPAHGRVFVPHDPAYRPYRNGHWVQSAEGLVWVSYDAIGWAVCHYGQWLVLDDDRWAWVPGTEWAPAWVEWRRSDQYVGWAPQLVGGSAPIVDLWIFVEVAYLLADFATTVALPPARVAYAYDDCAPFSAREGGWYGPPRRWLRARGVRGIGRGRPTRVVRPGPPRRRPPPGRHVRPADGREIGGRIVGRGRAVRVRRPGEAPEDPGPTRVRRPDESDGIAGADERERPVLRLHGPPEPRGALRAADPHRERPSVDPRVAEPRIDVPTPSRARAPAVDPSRATPPRRIEHPSRIPRIERSIPRPIPAPRIERPTPRPTPAPRIERPTPRPTPAPRIQPGPPPRVHRPSPPTPRIQRPTPTPRVHRAPTPAPRIQRRPTPSAPPRVRSSPSRARPAAPPRARRPSSGGASSSRRPSRPAVRPSRSGELRVRRPR